MKITELAYDSKLSVLSFGIGNNWRYKQCLLPLTARHALEKLQEAVEWNISHIQVQEHEIIIVSKDGFVVVPI
jgi:hypothetical protein